MTDESLKTSTTIAAPAEAVFAVLADPVSHPAIDGTGWVTKALDTAPLTSAGQTFRMAMYHANHPDGSYEMINRVEVLEPPHAIAWQPGQDAEGDGNLQFGGWIWRYDLVPAGPASSDDGYELVASSARWCSEFVRCSTGNGGNWMCSRRGGGTADQS